MFTPILGAVPPLCDKNWKFLKGTSKRERKYKNEDDNKNEDEPKNENHINKDNIEYGHKSQNEDESINEVKLENRDNHKSKNDP